MKMVSNLFGKNEIKPDFSVFNIYDSKTESYRMPMYAINQFEMVRRIETIMSDPKNANDVLVTNPEDLTLFHTGYFSQKTGQYIPLDTFVSIVKIHELRQNPVIAERTLTKLMSTIEADLQALKQIAGIGTT